MEYYHKADGQWGIPADNSMTFDPEYFQGADGTCAIYSQYRLLQDYGYQGSVDQLIQEATERGWYNPERGTPVSHIGDLLELHDVPCKAYTGGNFYNLVSELAQGKRAIVTVDADELWSENNVQNKCWNWFKDLFDGGANHAVVVSGIDTSDPNNVMVTLTDSGTGMPAASYPLDEFMDAWKDGNCHYIVADNPPPQELHLPAMENFDYELGHVVTINGVPFDAWLDEYVHEFEEQVNLIKGEGAQTGDVIAIEDVGNLDVAASAAGLEESGSIPEMSEIVSLDLDGADTDAPSFGQHALTEDILEGSMPDIADDLISSSGDDVFVGTTEL